MKDIYAQALKAYRATATMLRQTAALYARQMIREIAGGEEGFDITPLNRDFPFVKIHHRGEGIAVEAFTADGNVWAAGEPFNLEYHLSDDDAAHVVESLELLKKDLKAGRIVKDVSDDGFFLRYP